MKLLAMPFGLTGPVSMEGASLFAGDGTFSAPIASAGGSFPVSAAVGPVLTAGPTIAAPGTPVLLTGTPVSGPAPVKPTTTVFDAPKPVVTGASVTGATVYTEAPIVAKSKSLPAVQPGLAAQALPKWVKPVVIGIVIALVAFLGYKYFVKQAKGRK